MVLLMACYITAIKSEKALIEVFGQKEGRTTGSQQPLLGGLAKLQRLSQLGFAGSRVTTWV